MWGGLHPQLGLRGYRAGKEPRGPCAACASRQGGKGWGCGGRRHKGPAAVGQRRCGAGGPRCFPSLGPARSPVPTETPEGSGFLPAAGGKRYCLLSRLREGGRGGGASRRGRGASPTPSPRPKGAEAAAAAASGRPSGGLGVYLAGPYSGRLKAELNLHKTRSRLFWMPF